MVAMNHQPFLVLTSAELPPNGFVKSAPMTTNVFLDGGPRQSRAKRLFLVCIVLVLSSGEFLKEFCKGPFKGFRRFQTHIAELDLYNG